MSDEILQCFGNNMFNNKITKVKSEVDKSSNMIIRILLGVGL